MARIEAARRELVATLLVAGAARAGKRSVLEAIAQRVPAARRLPGIAGAPGRLAWLPLDLGTIGGWQVRLQLYALPEAAIHDATRRMLLADADGLLVVLDAQAMRVDENLAALRRLQEQLLDRAGDLRDVPTVFLYTKQDLPEELVLPQAALDAALNFRGVPSVGGDVPRGTGVLEALHALVSLVLRRHGPPASGGGE